MVYKTGNVLSDPLINLHGNDQIQISFDELSDNETQFMYSIIHCNADWSPSILSRMEYQKGFSENYVEDYDYSFNTNINYVHYKISIPNEDVTLTKSGNYTVLVYPNDNPDSIICTACFYVLDQRVDIEASVDFSTLIDIKKSTQQINLNVLHPNYTIQDPFGETHLVVQQNHRTDNQVIDIAPTFTRPGELRYTENRKLIFMGGNEYRNFDAVSTRVYGEGIYSINYYNPYNHITLYPDKTQDKKPYFFKNDINGRFYIRRQEADQDALALETDYIFVHFSIPMEDPLLTGEIYLNGAFTYNKLDKSTKMVYNFDSKMYEGTQFLKQGYYNYRYLFLPTRSNTTHNKPIENDYYETENDYYIYFYHRAMGERYDKLVGYVKINTLNRL